ncbi:MAG: hypothetical protein PHI18_10260 [bacterium]|nr:hypothetical protein [bacterium]
MFRAVLCALIAAAAITGCGGLSREDVIGEHRGIIAPNGGPQRNIVLFLNDDRTAEMRTQQLDTADELVETGTWKLGGSQVHVKLRRQGDRPVVNDFSLELRESGLMATTCDRERYGEAGFTLRRVSW